MMDGLEIRLVGDAGLEIRQIGDKKMLVRYDPSRLVYEMWPLLQSVTVAAFAESAAPNQQDIFLDGYVLAIRLLERSIGNSLLRGGR
jgi:hypothetical protein